jgi:hypothetical protein
MKRPFLTKTRDNSKPRKSLNEVRDEIGKLAYQFYVDRGSKPGHSMDDWLRAERIVKAKYNIE